MHPGQKLKPGVRVVFEGAGTLNGEVLEQEPRPAGDSAVDRGRLAGGTRRRWHWPRAAAAVHQRARIGWTIANGIRPCSPASAARWPRRPPGCTSRAVEALKARGDRAGGEDHAARRLRHVPARASRAGRGASAGARTVPRRGAGRRGREPGDRRGAACDAQWARRRPGRSRPSAGQRRASRRPAAAQRTLHLAGLRYFASSSGLLTNFHLPQSSLLMLVVGVCRPQPRARGISRGDRGIATGFTAMATRCWCFKAQRTAEEGLDAGEGRREKPTSVVRVPIRYVPLRLLRVLRGLKRMAFSCQRRIRSLGCPDLSAQVAAEQGARRGLLRGRSSGERRLDVCWTALPKMLAARGLPRRLSGRS